MNRPTISCDNPKGTDPIPSPTLPLKGRARRWECLLLLIGLGWAGGAWAGDPTEPPAAWLAAQPPAPGVAAGTVQALPRTQMIVTGKTRKFALIDGDIVKVGDQYKDSKVVAIKADKVVMEDASKSLRVTPDVEKKKASRGVASKQPKRIVVGGTPATNEKQTGDRSSQ